VNFSQRSYKKELLDGDNIPMKDIARNMKEIGIINNWLGGHRITIRGFKMLAENKKEITVCEIGSGGGDNLKAIYRWCEEHQIRLRCIGIDIKQECIDYARKNCSGIEDIQWICSDYSKVYFDEKPDIIFSSLFCHHFTNEEIKSNITWMKENSNLGFFINDLHRHPLAYYSIKWLSAVFSKSYLLKNDAPLSVLRGFSRRDWEMINSQWAMGNGQLKWQWAFRWLLVVKNDK
jgi:2-polyprenyl-3-methyl-5-hydroxy-6-metoxy-1,4-benzoquinol methylase